MLIPAFGPRFGDDDWAGLREFLLKLQATRPSVQDKDWHDGNQVANLLSRVSVKLHEILLNRKPASEWTFALLLDTCISVVGERIQALQVPVGAAQPSPVPAPLPASLQAQRSHLSVSQAARAFGPLLVPVTPMYSNLKIIYA